MTLVHFPTVLLQTQELHKIMLFAQLTLYSNTNIQFLFGSAFYSTTWYMRPKMQGILLGDYHIAFRQFPTAKRVGHSNLEIYIKLKQHKHSDRKTTSNSNPFSSFQYILFNTNNNWIYAYLLKA